MINENNPIFGKREFIMSKHRDDESQTCTPIQFFAFGETVNTPCRGQTVELFRTTHHIKARNANVELENFGNCPVTFTIVECNGKTVTEVVQPNSVITILFPCIKSVSVTCGQNPIGNCNAIVNITYTLCVCCEQEES
jgi:hypothetical protein